jgi:hypothetical protein
VALYVISMKAEDAAGSWPPGSMSSREPQGMRQTGGQEAVRQRLHVLYVCICVCMAVCMAVWLYVWHTHTNTHTVTQTPTHTHTPTPTPTHASAEGALL